MLTEHRAQRLGIFCGKALNLAEHDKLGHLKQSNYCLLDYSEAKSLSKFD